MMHHTATTLRPVPRLTVVAAAMIAVVALSGCSEARRALGYEKNVPDEFQVVERAPLALPPDFTLRPPQPGAARPQEGNTRDQARRAMVGGTGRQPTAQISTQNRSAGDVALLKRAGADRIQPDIRALVNKETQSLADTSRSFADEMVFWRKPDPVGYRETLDAPAEAQRLRQNQALGESVTKGESPKIERGRRGILQGIW